jgi:hypothetical protein
MSHILLEFGVANISFRGLLWRVKGGSSRRELGSVEFRGLLTQLSVYQVLTD